MFARGALPRTSWDGMEEDEQDWEGGTQIDPVEHLSDCLVAEEEARGSYEVHQQGRRPNRSSDNPQGVLFTARDAPVSYPNSVEYSEVETQPTEMESAGLSPIAGAVGVQVGTRQTNEAQRVGFADHFRISSKLPYMEEVRNRNISVARRTSPSFIRGPAPEIFAPQGSYPYASSRDYGVVEPPAMVRPSSVLRRIGQGSGSILSGRRETTVPTLPQPMGESSASPYRAPSFAPLRRSPQPPALSNATRKNPRALGVSTEDESTLDEHDVVHLGAFANRNRASPGKVSSSGVSTFRLNLPSGAHRTLAPWGPGDSPGFFSSAEGSLRGPMTREGGDAPSASSSDSVPPGWLERQLSEAMVHSPSRVEGRGYMSRGNDGMLSRRKHGVDTGRGWSTTVESHRRNGETRKDHVGNPPSPSQSASTLRGINEAKRLPPSVPSANTGGWIRTRSPSSRITAPTTSGFMSIGAVPLESNRISCTRGESLSRMESTRSPASRGVAPSTSSFMTAGAVSLEPNHTSSTRGESLSRMESRMGSTRSPNSRCTATATSSFTSAGAVPLEPNRTYSTRMGPLFRMESSAAKAPARPVAPAARPRALPFSDRELVGTKGSLHLPREGPMSRAERKNEAEEEAADGCMPVAESGALPDTQDMLGRDMSQERRRLSQKMRETDGAIDRALREARALYGVDGDDDDDNDSAGAGDRGGGVVDDDGNDDDDNGGAKGDKLENGSVKYDEVKDDKAHDNNPHNDNRKDDNAEDDNAEADNVEDHNAEDCNAKDDNAGADDVEDDNAEVDNAEDDNAKIDNAKVDDVEDGNAKVEDARVDNAKVDNAKADNAEIDNAKIDNAKVDNAKVDNVEVDNAKVDNAKVDNAKVDNAKVDNAKVDNAKVDNAKVDNAKVDNAKVDNAKVDNAKVDNAKVDNAKVDSAEVDDAENGEKNEGDRLDGEDRGAIFERNGESGEGDDKNGREEGNMKGHVARGTGQSASLDSRPGSLGTGKADDSRATPASGGDGCPRDNTSGRGEDTPDRAKDVDRPPSSGAGSGTPGKILHGRRKLMRANVLDGNRGTPLGSSGRRGVSRSTPGAYMGTSGSNMAKKRRMQSASRPEEVPSGSKSVFEISSDDDDGSSDERPEIAQKTATATPRGKVPEKPPPKAAGKRVEDEAGESVPESAAVIRPKCSDPQGMPSGYESVPPTSREEALEGKGVDFGERSFPVISETRDTRTPEPSTEKQVHTTTVRSWDEEDPLGDNIEDTGGTAISAAAARTCSGEDHDPGREKDGRCEKESVETRKTVIDIQMERTMAMIRQYQVSPRSEEPDVPASQEGSTEALPRSGEPEKCGAVGPTLVNAPSTTAVPGKPEGSDGSGTAIVSIAAVTSEAENVQSFLGKDTGAGGPETGRGGAATPGVRLPSATIATDPGADGVDRSQEKRQDGPGVRPSMPEGQMAEESQVGESQWRESQGGEVCPVEFRYLWPFLASVGWTIKRGRGLDTWLYVKPQTDGDKSPGGKRGKHLVRGRDYFADEEDVIAFAKSSENEPLLRAFRRFGRKHLEISVYSGCRRASLLRASSDKGAHVGGGGDEDSIPSVDGSIPGPGDRPGAVDSSAAVTTGVQVSNKFSEALSTECHPDPVRQHVADQSHIHGVGAREAPAGILQKRPSSTLSGIGVTQEQTVEEGDRRREWHGKWEEAKRRMAEDGWRIVDGTGIITWVYLMKGVTKTTGRLGIDMFHSRAEVIEHFFGPAAVTRPPNEGGDVVWEEWNLSKHRAKRRRCDKTPAGTVSPLDEEGKNGRAIFDVDPSVVVPAPMENTAAPPRTITARRTFSRSSSADSMGSRDSVFRPEGAGFEGHSSGGKNGEVTFPNGKRVSKGGGTPVGPGCLQRIRRVGSRKDLSEKRPGGGMQDARKECLESSEVGGTEYPMEDEVDDIECSTQPQHELASALNMATVGRSLEGTRCPSSTTGVIPGAGAVSDAGQEKEDGAATKGSSSGLSTPNCTLTSRSTTPVVQDATKTRSALTREPPSPATGVSRCTHESPAGAAALAWSSASPPPCGGDEGARADAAVSSPASGRRRGRGDGAGSRATGLVSPLGSGLRVSTRRSGNNNVLHGVGVLVTGCRDSVTKRPEVEKSIRALGGTVITFSPGTGNGGSDHWSKWLPIKDDGETRGLVGGEKRMVLAMATPESYRTSKYYAAVAAGADIVHPFYLRACQKAKTKPDTAGYLLPLGRSALGRHGLVMPRQQTSLRGDIDEKCDSRYRRPFRGKDVLLCLEAVEQTSSGPSWVHVFIAAGARVTTVDRDGIVNMGGRAGTRMLHGDRDLSRVADLEGVLRGLRRGDFDCMIGTEMLGVSSAANPNGCTGTHVKVQTLNAARQGGVPTGTFEWAAQCVVHGRLLSCDGAACPWFPLDPREPVSLHEDDLALRRKSGSGGVRRSKAKGKPPLQEPVDPALVTRFFVYCTRDGRRHVPGDYVLMPSRSGGTAVDGRRKEDGVQRAGTPSGECGVAAAGPKRVARILRFVRSEGEVRALVSLMDVDGKVVWATLDCDQGEGGERGATRVPPAQLGSRVMVIEEDQVDQTAGYSLDDPNVFILKSRA